MEITPYATKHTGAFLSFLELYHKNPFWMPVSVHGTGGKKGHRSGDPFPLRGAVLRERLNSPVRACVTHPFGWLLSAMLLKVCVCRALA
jgi:hypothetical protein